MRFAAFVRNVMIGREGLHRDVLLDIFERAGATSARSYISTGNVTFTCPPRRTRAITERVEEGIAAVIGRHEGVYVRSLDYLDDLVATEPFAAAPFPDPFEHTVSFLRGADITIPDLPLESGRGDVVVFAATATELFAVNQMVEGRTSGAGGLIEKTLQDPVTTRNWNTVLRIVADPE